MEREGEHVKYLNKLTSQKIPISLKLQVYYLTEKVSINEAYIC